MELFAILDALLSAKVPSKTSAVRAARALGPRYALWAPLLVAGMNGTIRYVRAEGRTVFEITLPLAPAATESRTVPEMTGVAVAGRVADRALA